MELARFLACFGKIWLKARNARSDPMSKEKAPPECVYCGKPADTKDHIPPKAIIPEQARNNILLVPSCSKCNNGFSKDDEYLMHLALAYGREKTIDARLVFEKVFRWQDKPNKKKAFDAIGRTLRKVVLVVGGKRVTTGAFLVETDRLMASCRRIIRGLYFNNTKKRLPEAYSVLAYPAGELDDCPAAVSVQRDVLQRPKNTVGNDAFVYRFQGDPYHPGVTAWCLEFYTAYRVYGITGPVDESGALVMQ